MKYEEMLREKAHQFFVVKLGFEITIVQQTKTRDQTSKGVVDHSRPPVPVVQPRPYLIQF